MANIPVSDRGRRATECGVS